MKSYCHWKVQNNIIEIGDTSIQIGVCFYGFYLDGLRDAWSHGGRNIRWNVHVDLDAVCHEGILEAYVEDMEDVDNTNNSHVDINGNGDGNKK